VLVGRHSDRTGERKLHVAACAGTAGLGLLLAIASQGNLLLLVLSFTLSQMGQRSVMSVFWAIPPMFLGGTAAAAGIGLINAIGNLGGFFGPSVMGWLRDATGGYTGGLLVLACALAIEAILVMTIRLPSRSPAAAKVA
jgi:ACS family tartrate transporter-like MFS transporter